MHCLWSRILIAKACWVVLRFIRSQGAFCLIMVTRPSPGVGCWVVEKVSKEYTGASEAFGFPAYSPVCKCTHVSYFPKCEQVTVVGVKTTKWSKEAIENVERKIIGQLNTLSGITWIISTWTQEYNWYSWIHWVALHGLSPPELKDIIDIVEYIEWHYMDYLHLNSRIQLV